MVKTAKNTYLLEPEIRDFVEKQPDILLTDETLEDIREKSRIVLPDTSFEKYSIDFTEIYVPSLFNAPDIRILMFKPQNIATPLPVYVDIHGGGMVLGTPELGNEANSVIVSEVGCIVISIDYRLAPETIYPGQVEDCYSVLKWIQDNSDEIGINTDKIAIGGASAGGGIAAALAVYTRDKNEIEIKFLNLTSPMLDDRTCVNNTNKYAGEFGWNVENNYYGWKSLLGHDPGIEGVSPYASAPRAESLAGLPPTFIFIGSIDLFVNESIDFARRLINDGVFTELHVHPGLSHAGVPIDSRYYKLMFDEPREALKRAFSREFK